MTLLAPAAAQLAAATSKTTTSSGGSVFLLVLIAVVAVAYFAFLRPQQQRAKQQRARSREVEVGDEVLTVGGIVGRVVDVTGDRVTIVSGEDGGPAAMPTRLVIVKQGIARKIEPEGAPPGDATGDGTKGDGPPGEEPGT